MKLFQHKDILHDIIMMDNYDMVSIHSGQISLSQTNQPSQILPNTSVKTESATATSTLTNTYMVKNTSENADLNSLSIPIKKKHVTIIDPEIIRKYKFTKTKASIPNNCNKENNVRCYLFLKVAVLATLVSGTVFYMYKK